MKLQRHRKTRPPAPNRVKKHNSNELSGTPKVAYIIWISTEYGIFVGLLSEHFLLKMTEIVISHLPANFFVDFLLGI